MGGRPLNRSKLDSWLVGDVVKAWALDPLVAQQVVLQVLRAVQQDLAGAAAVLADADEVLGQGARSVAVRIEFALGRLAGKTAQAHRRAKRASGP